MQLYALCDRDLCEKHNISVTEFVQIAKSHKATIIQYRDKNSDIITIKNQLIEIRKIYDGFLIVNDNYELIQYCDGIHVGQDDLRSIDSEPLRAVKILREVVGKEKLIGISTHNKDEILQANEMDINYIGLGAFRDTSTKDNIQNTLGSSLDDLASLSKHPIGAIGGVKLEDKFSNVTYLVIGSGLLG